MKFKFKLTVLFNLPKNMANGRLEISIRHHGVLKGRLHASKYYVQVRSLSKENTYLEFKNTKPKTFSVEIRGYLEGMCKIEYKLNQTC